MRTFCVAIHIAQHAHEAIKLRREARAEAQVLIPRCSGCRLPRDRQPACACDAPTEMAPPFSAQMKRNLAGHEMATARHLKRLGDRAIPADDYYGHPPGCPDGDYCVGNRMCFWRCDDDGEDE